jgi:hypothetical protein
VMLLLLGEMVCRMNLCVYVDPINLLVALMAVFNQSIHKWALPLVGLLVGFTYLALPIELPYVDYTSARSRVSNIDGRIFTFGYTLRDLGNRNPENSAALIPGQCRMIWMRLA